LANSVFLQLQLASISRQLHICVWNKHHHVALGS
jgi:hypothetical protein